MVPQSYDTSRMELSTEASLTVGVRSPGERRADWDEYGRNEVPSIGWASSLSYFRQEGKRSLERRSQRQASKIKKGKKKCPFPHRKIPH